MSQSARSRFRHVADFNPRLECFRSPSVPSRKCGHAEIYFIRTRCFRAEDETGPRSTAKNRSSNSKSTPRASTDTAANRGAAEDGVLKLEIILERFQKPELVVAKSKSEVLCLFFILCRLAARHVSFG
ncbi:hypothetical protein Trydic_g19388 [Trypoxylus dichotomus]